MGDKLAKNHVGNDNVSEQGSEPISDEGVSDAGIGDAPIGDFDLNAPIGDSEISDQAMDGMPIGDSVAGFGQVDPAADEQESGAGIGDTMGVGALNFDEAVSLTDESIGETSSSGARVKKAQFAPFTNGSELSAMRGLDLLLDVGLHVTVELGQADMPIKDVLAIGPGSIVELDKLAGDNVDVLVNGMLIARGEVVVVDEKFGVRVSDVVSPATRIQSLVQRER